MPIITLTTDWNNNDYYSGAVKGAIYGNCPDVKILDISNSILPFNISQAAFVLKSCYKNFPAGTIHIIGVRSDPDRPDPFLAVLFSEQYFLLSNNGMIDMITEDNPRIVYCITKFGEYSTFPELEIFAKAACHIANGNDINKIGNETKNLDRQMALLPLYDSSSITGTVIYIDTYKNAITNIPSELFKNVGKGRQFEIFIGSNNYRTRTISRKYSDVPDGNFVSLFNSQDLLEIGIYNGRLCDLISLNINSNIRVKFI